MNPFRKSWDPKSKICFITGGSQGLGLSLAILLAKKGANVTIVARNKEKLASALMQIEKCRQNPDQVFRTLSFSLDTAEGSAAAVEAECEANNGRVPDAFFLCAGSSKPFFWVENSSEDLANGMNQAYWAQAWTAHAASKKMIKAKQKGKIAFVSSTAALVGVLGYSSYSPGKAALRSLADTLKCEFLLYDIDVHIFFACTLLTPGYDEEMKTKPEVLKKIEEADDALTADQAALVMFKGIQRGHYQISGNFTTSIFAASTRSTSPSSNVFFDFLLDIIAWIAVPVWLWTVKSTVLGHRQKHEAHLAERKLM